jgi:hypothetical protein
MPCPKFDDWLALPNSGADWQPPEGLLSHVKQCPECARKLNAAKAVRREFARVAIPGDRLEASWKKIAAHLPEETENSSLWTDGWKAFLGWKWLIGASAVLGMVVLLMVPRHPVQTPLAQAPISQTPVADSGSPVVSPVGSLCGFLGTIRRNVWESALSRQNLEIRDGDELVLSQSHSWSEVAFADGTRVKLEGICTLRLQAGRLDMKSGVCLVSLEKGRAPFHIQIPGATFGIRGTVLRFHLTANGGTIDLLEGVIDVEPSGGRPAAFSWQAGTRLTFHGGSLLGKPIMIPAKGTAPFARPAPSASFPPQVPGAVPSPGPGPGTSTLASMTPSAGISDLNSIQGNK